MKEASGKRKGREHPEDERASQGWVRLREAARRKTHHRGDRFASPFGPTPRGRLSRLLRWKLCSPNPFKPGYAAEQVKPVRVRWDRIQAPAGLSITFVKHACVLIRDRDRVLLVDPVFFSPFRFIRDFTPLEFDPRTLPSPDHVLITHGHYDHLDRRTLALFPKQTHLLTPLGYQGVFRRLGMENRTAMDWFDVWEDGDRRIVFLPARHWTLRTPWEGVNRSLWGSYWIRTASGPCIWISGDTAYFPECRGLGREFPVDLAVLNLGAYEPRWFMAQSHMNPAEAACMFRELGASWLLPVHWGTFRLGDEPVYLPPQALRREMAARGLDDRLVDLHHGETGFFDSKGEFRKIERSGGSGGG